MSKDPTYRSDQEDFEKYFSDKISDSERHELESHALDDAFEAEAMEGWAEVPVDVAKADMADLRDRLKPEKKGSNWYKIAAAVALLIVSSVLVLNTIDQSPEMLAQDSTIEEPPVQETESIENQSSEPEEESTPALKKKEPEVTEDLGKDLIEPPVTENLVASQDSNTPEIEANYNSRATAPILQAKSEVSEESTVASLDVSDLEIVESETETPVQVLAAEGLDEEPVKLRLETNIYSAANDDFFVVKSKSDWTYRQIQGNVLDEEGQIVSDARIVLNGTNILAVSDFSGKFEMAIPDSLVTPTLTFSSEGLSQLDFKIEREDTFDVVMARDAHIGFRTAFLSNRSDKKSTTELDIETFDETNFVAASPEGGFKKFEKYLKKNTRTPDTAKQLGIKGTVLLSIDISDSGELTDIKVKRGLGAGCDEEAIRVVKEGPIWIPAQLGNNKVISQIEVEVKFN